MHVLTISQGSLWVHPIPPLVDFGRIQESAHSETPQVGGERRAQESCPSMEDRGDNTIVYAANAVNEYTTIGGVGVAYDACGNLMESLRGVGM